MRSWLVAGLVFGALAAASGPLAGQAVRGGVTDRSSGEPLAGATLSLLTRQGAPLARATTDERGGFELVAPGPGTYRIQAAQPGFRVLVTPPFQLRSGEVLDYALRLTPAPATALDTATVRGQVVPRHLADFYRRKQMGLGKFVTREQFERYNPVMVTDVLRREQAFDISVNPNRRVGGDTRTLLINSRRAGGGAFGPVNGDCPPLIFMDGTYLGNARDVDPDDVLFINSIEAFEFYESGVEVPLELARNGSNCGVIAVWSRTDAGGAIAQGYHWIDVGSQIGAQWANGGMQYGRAGAQVSVRLTGPVEFHAAFNLLIRAWNGPDARRSGHQITVALRARPFGAGFPGYLGAGVTTQDLTEQALFGISQVERELSQQDVLLLAGVTLPLARIRPMAEVQVLDPAHPGQAQLHLFTGLTVRLH